MKRITSPAMDLKWPLVMNDKCQHPSSSFNLVKQWLMVLKLPINQFTVTNRAYKIDGNFQYLHAVSNEQD